MPQPVKGLLASFGIRNREVARRYGFSDAYVGRALNGRTAPSPRFREAMRDLLNLPDEEMFWPERQAVSDLAERARRVVDESCAEQGLPAKVTDPLVLARVARLVARSEEFDTDRRPPKAKAS